MFHTRRLGLLFAFLCLSTPCEQKGPRPVAKPVDATVCQIMEKPSAYNNKLVKVRALVRVSAEYSLLQDKGCSDAIWLVLADQPGLVASTNASASNRSTAHPKTVQVLRDSNYKELLRYLQASAKGESCLDAPSLTSPPDCRSYRVTATFVGRIDGVSEEIHAAHLKRSSRDAIDGKGFGHMGMFDAQLVVQSVENVQALDESEPVR